jgi:hypothetical protein
MSMAPSDPPTTEASLLSRWRGLASLALLLASLAVT